VRFSGALLLTPRSFATSLRHPRVLLALYLGITIPALLAVAPAVLELDRAFSRHPDATVAWNQALDLDFERLHGDLAPGLTGGILFAILLWTYFSGAILACVGPDRRCRFTEFMAAGGRAFFRNARVVVLLALALLVWAFGYDLVQQHLEDWLRSKGSPRKILLVRSAVEIAYAGGCFALSFVAHLAMAIVSTAGRRSAVLGWFRAVAFVLLHPVRCSVSVAVMVAIWVAGLFLLGKVAAWQLGEAGNPWVGLAAAQAGILYFQAGGVALLVLARTLVAGDFESEEAHEVREVRVEAFEV
jgi:hypothetical protein